MTWFETFNIFQLVSANLDGQVEICYLLLKKGSFSMAVYMLAVVCITRYFIEHLGNLYDYWKKQVINVISVYSEDYLGDPHNNEAFSGNLSNSKIWKVFFSWKSEPGHWEHAGVLDGWQ